MNFAALGKKRRTKLALKFLEDAEQSFNGQPPIPEDLAVGLKVYGTVWKGRSAVTVRLIGNREIPLDYRLAFERTGPAPEDVVVDPERGGQLRGLIAECIRDCGDLRALIDRPKTNPGKAGSGHLSERDVEVLRIFGLDLVPGGVASAGRRVAAEGGR